MKNAGLAGAIALCGIGLIMIGLGNFTSTPTAMATAPAVAPGGGEPTIVWYGTMRNLGNDGSGDSFHMIVRAWSDGLIEGKPFSTDGLAVCGVFENTTCSWVVIASPTEGLNAAADINFDEVVNGQDLAVLLARWGDAPRNPMPPSDCPLGLLN